MSVCIIASLNIDRAQHCLHRTWNKCLRFSNKQVCHDHCCKHVCIINCCNDVPTQWKSTTKSLQNKRRQNETIGARNRITELHYCSDSQTLVSEMLKRICLKILVTAAILYIYIYKKGNEILRQKFSGTLNIMYVISHILMLQSMRLDVLP
jgi:hypothetical protein